MGLVNFCPVFLFITAVSNGANLIDGIDGLAGNFGNFSSGVGNITFVSGNIFNYLNIM
jgi:phospho-N-acetylmuramoyl-pentapeptide-transferase